MKKPNKFNGLSAQTCNNCTKPLKQNIVKRKETATLCFECFRKTAKCPIVTAREARTGKVYGRKKGVYGMPD